MSKENAKKFYDEIVVKGEQDAWFGKSAAELQEIIQKESLDFTIDEIKEVIRGSVTSQEMSDAELDIAAGGGDRANCTDVYYKGDCTATVEAGSWCGSDDWCNSWDSTYECPDTYVPPCGRNGI